MAGSSLKWDDRKLKKEVALTAYQKIEKGLIMIESDAKRLVRVDTGRLRSSLTHEIEVVGNKIIGRTGTNVNYAIPQEYGTSRMSAQPYLRPSLKKNIPRIRQSFRGQR